MGNYLGHLLDPISDVEPVQQQNANTYVPAIPSTSPRLIELMPVPLPVAISDSTKQQPSSPSQQPLPPTVPAIAVTVPAAKPQEPAMQSTDITMADAHPVQPVQPINIPAPSPQSIPSPTSSSPSTSSSTVKDSSPPPQPPPNVLSTSTKSPEPVAKEVPRDDKTAPAIQKRRFSHRQSGASKNYQRTPRSSILEFNEANGVELGITFAADTYTSSILVRVAGSTFSEAATKILIAHGAIPAQPSRVSRRDCSHYQVAAENIRATMVNLQRLLLDTSKEPTMFLYPSDATEARKLFAKQGGVEITTYDGHEHVDELNVLTYSDGLGDRVLNFQILACDEKHRRELEEVRKWLADRNYYVTIRQLK
jgi:hypothetical protein